jgi:hypothetical protein
MECVLLRLAASRICIANVPYVPIPDQLCCSLQLKAIRLTTCMHLFHTLLLCSQGDPHLQPAPRDKERSSCLTAPQLCQRVQEPLC